MNEAADIDKLVRERRLKEINDIIRSGKDTDFAAWIKWRLNEIESNIHNVLPDLMNECAMWKAVGQLALLRSLETYLFSEVMESQGEKDDTGKSQ